MMILSYDVTRLWGEVGAVAVQILLDLRVVAEIVEMSCEWKSKRLVFVCFHGSICMSLVQYVMGSGGARLPSLVKYE